MCKSKTEGSSHPQWIIPTSNSGITSIRRIRQNLSSSETEIHNESTTPFSQTGSGYKSASILTSKTSSDNNYPHRDKSFHNVKITNVINSSIKSSKDKSPDPSPEFTSLETHNKLDEKNTDSISLLQEKICILTETISQLNSTLSQSTLLSRHELESEQTKDAHHLLSSIAHNDVSISMSDFSSQDLENLLQDVLEDQPPPTSSIEAPASETPSESSWIEIEGINEYLYSKEFETKSKLSIMDHDLNTKIHYPISISYCTMCRSYVSNEKFKGSICSSCNDAVTARHTPKNSRIPLLGNYSPRFPLYGSYDPSPEIHTKSQTRSKKS